MITAGTILIADDERSFLRSTTELLRRDGYECDAARDADETVQMLQSKRYDLLIADIKMPGNADFRVVRAAQQYAPGMPVILVTGYPSVDSAVAAVGLPVFAYMIKPIDYDLLLKHVETLLRTRPQYRVLAHVVEQLDQCAEELKAVLPGASQQVKAASDAGPEVSALTVRRLALCVGELLKLHAAHAPRVAAPHLCRAVDCPQWPAHENSFQNVIEILHELKKRFKSKELAELRERLEEHLGIRRS